MLSKTAAGFHSETNELYRLRDSLAQEGCAVLDLVSGNVTEQGITFPQALLEEIVLAASRVSRVYRPDSFGRAEARHAIARYYAQRGVAVPPGNIVLTPGTSIAYWYCFKLLADPGEEFLCPSPGYPLFDYIAALSGVKLIPYPLDEELGWSINLEELENRISNATRAIILISPHNPTGRVTTAEELQRLAELARRHHLAIIADEVFCEFLLGDGVFPPPAAAPAPLVFTLNGFSKMFALPGLKLGWIAVCGEQEPVGRALRALEITSDTFLPVSEISQAMVPELLERGAPFLKSYRGEIRRRWGMMETLLRDFTCGAYVRPDAGFYLTLRLTGVEEESAAKAILSNNLALIHPGYFYDMKPHHLVLSFVHQCDIMKQHMPAIFSTLLRLAKGLPG